MNFIKLRISGENIDLDKISNTLSITPKFMFKKGDVNYNKITKEPVTYSEDCWIAETEVEHEKETEEKAAEFIDMLYENKTAIRQLSAIHHVTLWITLYQETSQYNLHFSKETLSKINELGIELDINCMQLQEFYS